MKPIILLISLLIINCGTQYTERRVVTKTPETITSAVSCGEYTIVHSKKLYLYRYKQLISAASTFNKELFTAAICENRKKKTKK